MFGHSGYAKLGYLKRSTKPRWQAYIPVSILAEIDKEDKANRKNTEEDRQVMMEQRM